MEDTKVLEMIDAAWEILESLVRTGKAQLRGGKLITPEKDPDLIRVIEHIARLKPPKTRRIPKVEDFHAQITSRQKAGQEASSAEGEKAPFQAD